MTYSDLIARGSGRPVFFLAIDGFPCVLGTTIRTPTDTWYLQAGGGGGTPYEGVQQYLQADSLRIGCRMRPSEVWPSLTSFTAVCGDPDLTLLEALKPKPALAATELSASCTDSDTTITVDSTTGFDSSGIVYLELEAIRHTGKTATTFTGCVRGYYGSEARSHTVDDTLFPPLRPEVMSGPADLDARRCRLYAGEIRNGVLSTTEQIWVGYVDGLINVGPGKISFRVTHVLQMFQKGSVFGWTPKGRLRGLYVPNYRGLRWGHIQLDSITFGSTTATAVHVDIVTDDTAEFFTTWRDFFDAAKVAIEAASADWHCDLMADGRVRIWYDGSHESIRMSWAVDDGPASQLLGFDSSVGSYRIGTDFIASGPRIGTFASLLAPSTADTDFYPRLYLRDGEADFFSESYVRIEDGSDTVYAAREVRLVNTTDDYIEVIRAVPDWEPGAEFWPATVMVPEGGTPPSVHQVWGFDGELADAVRALWSGQVFTGGASLGVTIPRRWLPGQALVDGDVDWNTLRNHCRELPDPIGRARFRISEPTQVADILGGLLLVAGICPYVKNDGTVGWWMISLPNGTEEATAVGKSMIDVDRVVDAKIAVSDDQLVNAVHLIVADGVRWLDDDHKRDLYLVDTNSLKRYGQQLVRDPLDPIAELKKAAREFKWFGPGDWSSVDLEQAMVERMRESLFALYARRRGVLPLPTGIKARALACGDTAAVTTDFVVDRSAATVGLSGKLAKVLGWSRDLGFEGGDRLDLLLIDESFGGIAPAALATGYNTGTKVLTFADTGIYHGSDDDTDLDHFAAGHVCRLIEYDDETPTTYDVEIASVDATAGTVTLTADYLGGGGVPSPYKYLLVYDDCTTCDGYYPGSDQIVSGFIWIGDDADGFVQDHLTAYDWSP